MANDENKHLTPVWIVYIDGKRLDTDHEITNAQIRLNEYGHEELEVCGANALYKLKRGSHVISYEKKTFSDAAKEIIGRYSQGAEMDTFGGKHDFSAEFGMTDYDYIMYMASLYGKEVYAFGSKIYVKNEVTVSKDEIIYEWGKSLISFGSTENVNHSAERQRPAMCL